MPFMSQESPVRRAGLKLASLEIKTFACPHAKKRQETGDAKMAAKSMAEETRMWSNSSFLTGMIEFCVYIYFVFESGRENSSACYKLGLAVSYNNNNNNNLMYIKVKVHSMFGGKY